MIDKNNITSNLGKILQKYTKKFISIKLYKILNAFHALVHSTIILLYIHFSIKLKKYLKS